MCTIRIGTSKVEMDTKCAWHQRRKSVKYTVHWNEGLRGGRICSHAKSDGSGRAKVSDAYIEGGFVDNHIAARDVGNTRDGVERVERTGQRLSADRARGDGEQCCNLHDAGDVKREGQREPCLSDCVCIKIMRKRLVGKTWRDGCNRALHSLRSRRTESADIDQCVYCPASQDCSITPSHRLHAESEHASSCRGGCGPLYKRAHIFKRASNLPALSLRYSTKERSEPASEVARVHLMPVDFLRHLLTRRCGLESEEGEAASAILLPLATVRFSLRSGRFDLPSSRLAGWPPLAKISRFSDLPLWSPGRPEAQPR